MHLMDLHARENRIAVQRALDRYMAAHHGVVGRATAISLGATKNLLRERTASGAWEVVHRTVYRSASAPPTREQQLLAAVLACGQHAVASHRSAAWLWGLLAAPPDLPDVALPYERRAVHKGIQVHRSTDLVGTGTSVRSGIVVTQPARTVLDVAAVVPPHVTAAVVDRAIAAKLLAIPALVAALEQYARPGRSGAGKLRAVLEERGVSAPGRAPSVLESAVARLLERLNIAPPVAEFEVAGGRFRFDFAWPEILFALEVHGWLAHSAFADWARDIEKRNWADNHGWEIYETTWEEVTKHPEKVATEIMRRIRRRRLAA
jgi:hypothetical protein